MTIIATLSDLRHAWHRIVELLNHDLTGGRALAADPVGVLRKHGYLLVGEAETGLRLALP